MTSLQDIACAMGIDDARLWPDLGVVCSEVRVTIFPETFAIQAYGEFLGDLTFSMLALEMGI